MDRASAIVLALALVFVGLVVTGQLSRAHTPLEHRVLDRDVSLDGATKLAILGGSTDVDVVSATGSPGVHVHVDLRGTNVPNVAATVTHARDTEVVALQQRGGVRSGWQLESGKATVTVRSPVDVTVRTGSGDVHVQRPPRAFAVQTGSGNVTVTDPAADVSAGTASGDVAVDLGDGFHGRTVSASTASGDVAVHVPDGFKATVQTHTVSGSVTDDAHVVPAAQPLLRLGTISGDIHIAPR